MQDHVLGRLFTAAMKPIAVLVVAGLLLSLAAWALGKWAQSRLLPAHSS